MALITERQDEVSINLLPDEIRTSQRAERLFQYGLIVAGSIVVLLLAVTVYFRLQINHQENVLTDRQAEATRLRGEVAALKEYADLKASVDTKRALLATALAGDLNWTKLLDDLDSTIPDDSRLSSFSVAPAVGVTPLNEVSLGTVSYTGTVPNMNSLADWLDTMSEITGLRFVYMSSGSAADGDVAFSASAHVNEGMLSGRCTTETSKCP